MEEEDFGAIGFMFDAEHSKETRIVTFLPNITISVKTIGDQPGHVQSGQYLWPASHAAAKYVIKHWNSLQCETIMELGAGCGLTGLVVSKLDGVKSVIFTDYDPGSLDLISDNVKLNSFDSNVGFHVHFLQWGKEVPDSVRSQCSYPAEGFRLILGADLLYCVEVVEPLFASVSRLLCEGGGLFVLVTSFSLEKVTTAIAQLTHLSFQDD